MSDDLQNDFSDGGSAFPFSEDIHEGNPGMALRDWFAGQALAGLCAKAGEAWKPHELANMAYQIANAMINRCVNR
jgi:hypothetical protein